MKHPARRILNLLLLAPLLAGLTPSTARGADSPISIRVDARDVSRRVLHAALRIPAQPGSMTLFYPKWIPGEHGPTGPITDLTALKITPPASPSPGNATRSTIMPSNSRCPTARALWT